MTESETLFDAVCRKIVEQNRELLARLFLPDFDPGVELDNTRNNAAYRLTDFFAALKLFPYGEVPYRLADQTVLTTDELVAAIARRYPAPNIRVLVHAVGLAFRRSKRIWRIRRPPVPMTQEAYAAALDACLEEILDALDNLNAALDLATCCPVASPIRKRGKHYGERDETLHRARADVVAAIRRKREKTGMSWAKCVATLRGNSAYVARMRGKSDATWVRYAKERTV